MTDRKDLNRQRQRVCLSAEQGSSGLTIPCAKACSMIVYSFSRTVTGSSSRPQVQTFSQRAGQTRDVNSGKQLVREPLISFPVETLVKQVVPVRAEIVERASGNHAVQRFAVLAERDAAIHAARGLLAARSLVKRGVKLAVCLNSLERSGRRIAFSL